MAYFIMKNTRQTVMINYTFGPLVRCFVRLKLTLLGGGMTS